MELKVIDLAPYLENMAKSSPKVEEELDPKLKALCLEVSAALRETGVVVVRDPRCSADENDKFLDMLERYFEQPDEFKHLHARPNLLYRTGSTPEGVEVPKCVVDEKIQEKMRSMPKEHQPLMPTGPDLKWRYMWRVGPRPKNTRFKELDPELITPEGFSEWKDTMDSWGLKMLAAVEVVAEMAAIGFGLPKDAFTSLMNEALHLLSPTGSDLGRHGQEGNVFAGYHSDTNFLTIHGSSRFPGLNIWLRNGQKVEVRIPRGCLLLQTGMEIERMTAGECTAGMHEVVVNKRTLEAIKLARQQNRSLWRVSSTLFTHTASDVVLKPLGHFAESPLASKYPPVVAGEFIGKQLSAINLGAKGA